jgi:activator of HSP90 ATPase
MQTMNHGMARRKWLTGAAAAFSGLAWAGAGEEISHAAESIHQEPLFHASRKRVYEALLDTKQFAAVEHLSAAVRSGMALGNKATQIDRQAGGTFAIYGGHIVGRHIELVPDTRIVQAWRVVDWDPGVYSIARFELVEQGSGTKIVFDHTGFPNGQAQHLAEGWKSNYWEPLEKYLSKSG